MCAMFVLVVTVLVNLPFTVGCDGERAVSLYNISDRDSSFLWQTGSGAISDNGLRPGWYQTVKDGLQYFMTDSSVRPGLRHCNTHWPIYLEGVHPDTQSITEAPLRLKACVHDYVSPCNISYDIMIRKCGREVQYFLNPTKHMYFSAYCFDQKMLLYPSPTHVDLGVVTVLPELYFSSITMMANITYNTPFLRFNCNFRRQGDFFYTVIWYVDNKFISILGPSKNTSLLSVDEQFLVNSNITLGTDFKCAVSVSVAESGQKMEPIYSEPYYAGVKIQNKTVYVDKGEDTYIQMKLTIPIGCKYTNIFSAACKEDIYISEDLASQCTSSILQITDISTTSRRCSVTLKTLTKDSRWNPDEIYTFKFATSDITSSEAVFNLRLQFGRTSSHRLLRNYILPAITVIVRDKNEYRYKVCYAHMDPHMRTADGFYYEHQVPGHFTLYENVKYGIEVQIATRRCISSTTVCTCGVAVRAGSDVFMINQCGFINFFDFTRCGDGGILQVQKVHDWSYNIFTPIGTKISILLFYYGQLSRSLNVDVIMAPKDFKNTRGMCGNFDSDRQNDQLEVEKYAPSSRLQTPDDLFLTLKDFPSWQETNGLFCICSANTTTGTPEALCSASQYLNCEVSKSITQNKCRVSTLRKRRAISRHKKDFARLVNLIGTRSEVAEISKQPPDAHSIPYKDALKHCRKTNDHSLTFQTYIKMFGMESYENSIAECVADVMVLNDSAIADTHIYIMANLIKNIIEKYKSNDEHNGVETFLTKTCPTNCEANGKCLDSGECVCNQYHHGPDCSIDERYPLVMDDIEGGGLCDFADGDDCSCFRIRSNNVLRDIQCSVTVTLAHVRTFEETRYERSFSGVYEDIFTVECCVPDNSSRGPNTFPTKYEFRISNNGINWSNISSIYLFDSTCQHSPIINGIDGLRTSLKDGFCFIHGLCVRDGEKFERGCLSCNSSASLYSWTEYNSCENGGSCSAGSTGYKCICLAGYEGPNCNEEIQQTHPGLE